MTTEEFHPRSDLMRLQVKRGGVAAVSKASPHCEHTQPPRDNCLLICPSFIDVKGNVFRASKVEILTMETR